MSDGVRTMWMRGGTSKGGYFLHDDLPQDEPTRDAVLMSVMGSPDTRQIDGMGGADPLTSKVALVRKSDRDGIDVDYLFLQVFVDQPIVTDAQLWKYPSWCCTLCDRKEFSSGPKWRYTSNNLHGKYWPNGCGISVNAGWGG